MNKIDKKRQILSIDFYKIILYNLKCTRKIWVTYLKYKSISRRIKLFVLKAWKFKNCINDRCNYEDFI